MNKPDVKVTIQKGVPGRSPLAGAQAALGCPSCSRPSQAASTVSRRVQGLSCRGLGCSQIPLFFSFAAAGGKKRASRGYPLVLSVVLAAGGKRRVPE